MDQNRALTEEQLTNVAGGEEQTEKTCPRGLSRPNGGLVDVCNECKLATRNIGTSRPLPSGQYKCTVYGTFFSYWAEKKGQGGGDVWEP